jgi:hypothetical protein
VDRSKVIRPPSHAAAFSNRGHGATLDRFISSVYRIASSPRIMSAAAVSLVCLAIIFVLIAAYTRGGDQDEYSTIYFSDSTIPFSSSWIDVWPTETNPPFFYIIARLFTSITGHNLAACRMINIIPLLFLLRRLRKIIESRGLEEGFLLMGRRSRPLV